MPNRRYYYEPQTPGVNAAPPPAVPVTPAPTGGLQPQPAPTVPVPPPSTTNIPGTALQMPTAPPVNQIDHMANFRNLWGQDQGLANEYRTRAMTTTGNWGQQFQNEIAKEFFGNNMEDYNKWVNNYSAGGGNYNPISTENWQKLLGMGVNQKTTLGQGAQVGQSAGIQTEKGIVPGWWDDPQNAGYKAWAIQAPQNPGNYARGNRESYTGPIGSSSFVEPVGGRGNLPMNNGAVSPIGYTETYNANRGNTGLAPSQSMGGAPVGGYDNTNTGITPSLAVPTVTDPYGARRTTPEYRYRPPGNNQ